MWYPMATAIRVARSKAGAPEDPSQGIFVRLFHVDRTVSFVMQDVLIGFPVVPKNRRMPVSQRIRGNTRTFA
jgi:hypothetical protein